MAGFSEVTGPAIWKRPRNNVGIEDAVPNEQSASQSTAYWTSHNVTGHYQFSSRADSIDFMRWRTKQYLGYDELMPVRGHDGLTIVDFGCGPGHDLVGFGEQSKPARLIGVDVSSTSLHEAANRLKLHDIAADLIQVDLQVERLDLPDASVDLVHCSGVLHHLADPEPVLAEFRRILKPEGQLQAMIYNRDSLWYHLYVPYVLMIEEQQFAGLALDEAFKRSTDGVHCPISRCYRKSEFREIVEKLGFVFESYGAAVSSLEMIQLPKRFHALLDRKLADEHRTFLSELTFDERGLPLHDGDRAGIDGCYRFRPNRVATSDRPRAGALGRLTGLFNSGRG